MNSSMDFQMPARNLAKLVCGRNANNLKLVASNSLIYQKSSGWRYGFMQLSVTCSRERISLRSDGTNLIQINQAHHC
jgi:hypothetical protein